MTGARRQKQGNIYPSEERVYIGELLALPRALTHPEGSLLAQLLAAAYN